ncbi:hypothetical protein [Bythopirellula polymerisocia]|uniref:Uncharacterized protein n=1 Tax=Bythopirellula polymerisocia TaxID=2528003 RepID=A0A5C6D0J4_9BACT|nr:hypothetical protein [Bythopirellula polymerisocia]TWU30390.1 hypothetical protein Pla144_11760 [Bythopirellula polymerisocia]
MNQNQSPKFQPQSATIRRVRVLLWFVLLLTFLGVFFPMVVFAVYQPVGSPIIWGIAGSSMAIAVVCLLVSLAGLSSPFFAQIYGLGIAGAFIVVSRLVALSATAQFSTGRSEGWNWGDPLACFALTIGLASGYVLFKQKRATECAKQDLS